MNPAAAKATCSWLQNGKMAASSTPARMFVYHTLPQFDILTVSHMNLCRHTHKLQVVSGVNASKQGGWAGTQLKAEQAEGSKAEFDRAGCCFVGTMGPAAPAGWESDAPLT